MSRDLDLYHYQAMTSSPTHTYIPKLFSHGLVMLHLKLFLSLNWLFLTLESSPSSFLNVISIIICFTFTSVLVMLLKIASWFLKIESLSFDCFAFDISASSYFIIIILISSCYFPFQVFWFLISNGFINSKFCTESGVDAASKAFLSGDAHKHMGGGACSRNISRGRQGVQRCPTLYHWTVGIP